jgi:hypothetical protein
MTRKQDLRAAALTRRAATVVPMARTVHQSSAKHCNVAGCGWADVSGGDMGEGERVATPQRPGTGGDCGTDG